MELNNLVEIKRNGHRGFITKILGGKYYVYDCDAKRGIWYGEEELTFIAKLSDILETFANKLASGK